MRKHHKKEPEFNEKIKKEMERNGGTRAKSEKLYNNIQFIKERKLNVNTCESFILKVRAVVSLSFPRVLNSDEPQVTSNMSSGNRGDALCFFINGKKVRCVFIW